jgi:hypothetical protein
LFFDPLRILMRFIEWLDAGENGVRHFWKPSQDSASLGNSAGILIFKN